MSSSTDRHRYRSHSTSSPSPRRQPDDLRQHISAKRSRPSSIRGSSYKDLTHDRPTEKWDVDMWRRGKRARRDSNVGESSDEGGSSGRLNAIGAAFPTLDAPASPSSGYFHIPRGDWSWSGLVVRRPRIGPPDQSRPR